MKVAGGYFPGSCQEMECDADEGVTALLGMSGPVESERAVARIAIMVQACDATAALIESALQVLEESAASAAGWPTTEVLLEVVRCFPPASSVGGCCERRPRTGTSRQVAWSSVMSAPPTATRWCTIDLTISIHSGKSDRA